MEDILASIRRILNEDEASPGPPSPPDASLVSGAADDAEPRHPAALTAAAPAEDESVLVLDEAMMVPDTTVPDKHPDTEPPVALVRPPEPVLSEPPSLLAPEAHAAAAASMGSLLRRLSSERGTQTHTGGPTIEDLVREEVRPLLKAWLDEHLPPMVERVVRQEIARLAGQTGP